ncbi:hypothetical protein J3B02_001991 [Coemansia erecta]|nr:hypothetical protein J3B02_001991 [Coemansia erecta]
MTSSQQPQDIDGLLKLEDSISDSPRYRAQMRQFDDYVNNLESSIQGLSKASKALHQTSLEYSARWTDVVSRVTAISKISPAKDPKIEQQLAGLGEVLMEIERGRMLHSEQLQQILVQPMETELGESGLITQVKNARRRADVLQSEYESQLARLMSRKPNESAIEQMEGSVESAKCHYINQMQKLSLDFNRLASVKRADFLESFLSLIYAQYAFYHQTFASLRDSEPAMRSLGAHVAASRRQAQESIDSDKQYMVSAQSLDQKRRSRKQNSGGSLDNSTVYVQVGQYEDEEEEDDDDEEDEYQDDYGYDEVGQNESKKSALKENEHGGRFGQGPEAKQSNRQSTADSNTKQVSGNANAIQQTHQRSIASISLSHDGQFLMCGYLFLRSQYSLMASWQRRWFEIIDGQLVHFQREDERDRESVPLHLCMVKQSSVAGSQDRRNVFELIAPNRTYILQAERGQELDAWKASLKQTIEASLYSHNPAKIQPAIVTATRSSSQPLSNAAPGSPLNFATANPAVTSALGSRNSGGNLSSVSIESLAISSDIQARASRMTLMRRPAGNDRCVDCGLSGPEWAAINLGVLMCIECSGIHRSLGVHVSKVRSVKLDNWEPELMHIMQRLGNSRVNKIFEANKPAADEPQKPTEQSLRDVKQPYILQKYSNRLYMDKPASIQDAEAKLIDAVRAADIPLALQALAQGADPNAYDQKTGSTPLIEAVGMSDFGMMELLFLWGADPNIRAKMTATAYLTESPKTRPSDKKPTLAEIAGGTALHWATRQGNVQAVWYLVRRGAQWDTPDAYGLLPLDIALEDSNVSVVMALRYAAFQKASGLQPGSVGSTLRPRMSPSSTGLSGNAATEPVDMLDMNDSFIREWAIPQYLPPVPSGSPTTDAKAAADQYASCSRSSSEEDFTEFAGSDTNHASAYDDKAYLPNDLRFPGKSTF